jgi:hypothetical protein
LLGAHTPSKNPPPVSRFQAYIAYSVDESSSGAWLTLTENGLRNGRRNARQTVLM